MKLDEFVREVKDTSETWKGSFEKYDCIWIVEGDGFPDLYEKFKRAIAEYLFDLRFGYRHFYEHMESFYKIKFSAQETGCADILRSFLEGPCLQLRTGSVLRSVAYIRRRETKRPRRWD
jgi:hypothetical protein